jgi:hypothetical protein
VQIEDLIGSKESSWDYDLNPVHTIEDSMNPDLDLLPLATIERIVRDPRPLGYYSVSRTVDKNLDF